ncbi:hypothetical protein B0T22DRAFT_508559 [Podospora appendiculata]|uniref:Uncharacterized protein n=1 Tax=Podospora appendiculata TaxID=314037 RepID=A0AAE0XKZ0_9PEZI|nr:hypothetical protein B0T22DRAFT_508559 [Podospora appendiculata]
MRPPDKYHVVQNYPYSVLPAPPQPLPADTISAMALRQQDNRNFQGRIEPQEAFLNHHPPPHPGANMNGPHLGSNGHHHRHQNWQSSQHRQGFPNGGPSHMSGAVYTKTPTPDEDNWSFREDEGRGGDGTGLIDRILAKFGRHNSKSQNVAQPRGFGNPGENTEKKGGRLRRTGRALCRMLGFDRPSAKAKGKKKIQIVRSPRSTPPLHDLMMTGAKREGLDPDYMANDIGDRGFQGNSAPLRPFPPTPPLRYDPAYHQGSSRNPLPNNRFAPHPHEIIDRPWNRPMDHSHPPFRPKLTLSTVQESDDWAHDSRPSQNRNYSHSHNYNHNHSYNPNTNTFLNPATNPALAAAPYNNPNPSQHYAPSSTAPTACEHRSCGSRRSRKKREAVPGRFASSWGLSQRAGLAPGATATNNTGPSPHPIADAHAGGAVLPTIPERFSSRLPWMRSRSSWASAGAGSYSSGAPSLTDSRRTSWNPFNLPGPPRQPLFGDMDLLSLPPLLSSLKGGLDTPKLGTTRSSVLPVAATSTTRASDVAAAPGIEAPAADFGTIAAVDTRTTPIAVEATRITTAPAVAAAAAAAAAIQAVPSYPSVRSNSPVARIPTPPAAVSSSPSVASSSPPARCSTFGARSSPMKTEPSFSPESPVARESAHGSNSPAAGGSAVISGSPAARGSTFAGSPATGRSSASGPSGGTRGNTSAEYSKVSTSSSRSDLSSQGDSGVDGLHVHLRNGSGSGYTAEAPALSSVTTTATTLDSSAAAKGKEKEVMGRGMERKSSFVMVNPAGLSKGKGKESEGLGTARRSAWAPLDSLGAESKDGKEGFGGAARKNAYVPLDRHDADAVREAWWKKDRRRTG